MKKSMVWAMMLVTVFLCASCTAQPPDNASHEGFALAYDISWQAKGYAEACLQTHLQEQNIHEYSIDKTAYAFVTDEVPSFLVSFVYTHGDELARYGYKFQVEDIQLLKDTEISNDMLILIEEGTETADFLLTDAAETDIG